VTAPPTPRNDLVEIFLTGIHHEGDGADQGGPQLAAQQRRRQPRRFRRRRCCGSTSACPATAQPNRLGVLAGDTQGFPNGRRLTDDVVDIALQAVEGAAQTGKLVDALAAGDKVDANGQPFSNRSRTSHCPTASASTRSTRATAPASRRQPRPMPVGPSAQPSALTANENEWMTPAIITAVVAAVLGIGAAIWAYWWRRRKPAATPPVESES
jgi:hypothetical protein